jgi:hypothetical protein
MFRYFFIGFTLLIAFIPIEVVYADTDISQLLQECKNHLQAKRLTSGRGGTAFDCYQDVLKKDANNAEALAGLEKMEALYVKWAKRALKRGQKEKAKRLVGSLRKVNPKSSALTELETQLEPAPQTSKEPEKSSKEPEKSDDKTAESEPSKEKTSSSDESDENKAAKSTESESPPPVKKPEPPKEIKIKDLGEIYELINTTDCLEWPSPEIKEKSGKNSWESFYPKKDDIGLLVAEMKHCHFDHNVYLLKLEEQYYVPISSAGVKILEKQPEATEESEKTTEEKSS